MRDYGYSVLTGNSNRTVPIFPGWQLVVDNDLADDKTGVFAHFFQATLLSMLENSTDELDSQRRYLSSHTES